MESSSQDRSLPASQRKLDQARTDGQTARSKDLSHLAVLGTGLALLIAFGAWGVEALQDLLQTQLRFDARQTQQPQTMLTQLGDLTLSGLGLVALFGLAVAAVAAASSLASGGWVYSFKPVWPDFSRINPLAGIGRLFSRQHLLDVLKVSVVAGLVLWLGWRHLVSGMDLLPGLVRQPSGAGMGVLQDWLVTGLVSAMLVVLTVALIDVPLQRFLHLHRLRMSHEELKKEHKDAEGNPQLKARMRALQREISNRNSVKAVPKADLVLMNPTHYAVALAYDGERMGAPRVVAKGADLIAQQIRQVAESHQVPVVTAPPLARALYAQTEIGHEIPSALYTAVAQMLAYVYRLRAVLRGEMAAAGAVPEPEVPDELDPHSPQFVMPRTQKSIR